MKASFFLDNSYSIGRTPLVRINHLTQGAPVTLLAKVEGRNPAYSIKDRIGASMVWDAEKRGILGPGKEIIEPTSGNTGIALAFVAAARGYAITLAMPENMSIERRKVAQALGARLLLTSAEQGMAGSIAKALELVSSDPSHYVLLQQFENPANPRIHYETTGPEIWNDTAGGIDVLVAGVGTGGTISGISRYIKQACGKPIVSVAVEPVRSPVITQTLNHEPVHPGASKIQGIGAGFIPDTLDLSLVDRVELADDDEAVDTARRMAREEGILCGISSGAAMSAALRLVRNPDFHGKMIVVVLPDAAERYLSTPVFEFPAAD